MLSCLAMLVLGAQVSSVDMEVASGRMLEALKAYHAERWWEAERAFEDAGRRMEGLPEMRDWAVYFRGKSLLKAGERTEAMHVFEGLARTAKDAQRVNLALDAFSDAGGVLTSLLPGVSIETAALEWWPGFMGVPGATWNPRSVAGDLAAAQRLLGHEALRDALGVRRDAPWKLVEAGGHALRAWIMVKTDDARWMLEAEAVGGGWRFVAVRALPSVPVESAGPESPEKVAARLLAASNLQRLRAIGFALVGWRSEAALLRVSELPARLHDLSDVAPGDRLWSHPYEGSAHDWLVYEGVVTNRMMYPIWLAAPQPFNGFREVLYGDGKEAMLDEAEFIAKAREQRWILPGVIRVQDVDAESATRIQAYIQQAGSGDRRERRTAEEALRQIGAPVYPFLEPLLKSEDPELRSLAEKLYQPKP